MVDQREIVRQHTNPRPGYETTDGRPAAPYGAKSSKSGVMIAAIAAVVVILALLLVFAGGDDEMVAPVNEPALDGAPVVQPDAAPLEGDAVAPTEVPSNPAEAPEAGAPATEGVPEETAPAATQ
ncbi:hypothetical protein ACW9UR_17250 [Halovulum sp. GXIMD14794]